MPRPTVIATEMPNCTLGLRGKMRNPAYCVGCDCDSCGWDKTESLRRKKMFSDKEAFPPARKDHVRHLKLT